MRQCVRDAFYPFNAPYEGEVPYMFQDVKGLVSIGVGLLIDPVERALRLPLVHASDGRPASEAEIKDEWLRIKNLPVDAQGRTAALRGHLYAKPHTKLRLTREGLVGTLQAKLAEMAGQVVLQYPEFDDWPADAQLATMSMAWACGPWFGKGFPKLAAALRARDWHVAVVECHMNERPNPSQPYGNPGLAPRNKANKILYSNARIVQESGLDPDVLAWPIRLADRIATPPEMPAVRPDQQEADPQPIVHDHSYPTGYDPAKKEPDE